MTGVAAKIAISVVVNICAQEENAGMMRGGILGVGTKHDRSSNTINTPQHPQPPARLRPHQHAISTTARHFSQAQTRRGRKAGQTFCPIIASASRSVQGATHRVQSAFSQIRHRVWAMWRQEQSGLFGHSVHAGAGANLLSTVVWRVQICTRGNASRSVSIQSTSAPSLGNVVATMSRLLGQSSHLRSFAWRAGIFWEGFLVI